MDSLSNLEVERKSTYFLCITLAMSGANSSKAFLVLYVICFSTRKDKETKDYWRHFPGKGDCVLLVQNWYVAFVALSQLKR